MSGGVVIGAPSGIRPAVDRAIDTMRSVWPRFNFNSALYTKAVESYPDDCVQSAAEEWCVSQQWPPKPVELAGEAKRFWRMRYASEAGQVVEVTTNPKLLARQQELREQAERLEKRARWLLETCPKPCTDQEALDYVSGVAGMAWRMASSDDERQALRDGRIGPEQYIAAVKAYREESRGTTPRAGGAFRAGAASGAGSQSTPADSGG